jgi:cytochrome P450
MAWPVTILGGLLTVFVASRLASRYRRWQWSRQIGDCASPRNIPSWELIFGLDLVYKVFKAVLKSQRVRIEVDELFPPPAAARGQEHKYWATWQSAPLGHNHRHVQTREAANAQCILATDFGKWTQDPRRGDAISELTGPGIITLDGEAWRNARAKLRPAFVRSSVADREMFEVHVGLFIEAIPRDGKPFNLYPTIDHLMLDALSDFIFGQSFKSLVPAEAQAGKDFLAAYNYGLGMAFKRYVLGPILVKPLSVLDRKYRASIRAVDSWTGRLIGQAIDLSKSPEQTKHAFAVDLATQTTDRQWLRNQLLQVFFGGRETSGVALSSALFALTRNPRVWSKLREELNGVEPEELTFEGIKGIKYLQWTMREGACPRGTMLTSIF